jgi:hypothetical protein
LAASAAEVIALAGKNNHGCVFRRSPQAGPHLHKMYTEKPSRSIRQNNKEEQT